MATGLLRLRWSWRDLRQRWVQVVVIALILAIGTGVFAALSSTALWRRASNDASFAATNVHDVEVTLSAGTWVPAGTLAGAAATIDDADALTAVEERLVAPTQVDVATRDGQALVPAVVVGTVWPPSVDRVWVRGGRMPTASDPPTTGLLERQFAQAKGVPTAGELVVAGARRFTWTGLAMQPEYFYVLPQGGVLDIGGQATLFLPVEGAQQLVGQPGQVNDLVVTLAPGTDRASVAKQLEKAVAAAGGSATATTLDDEPAYRVLYKDIDGDQKVWNLISFLILFGASFAAFNLINRIVEAQRREIGIGMALGEPRRRLAVRPMLVGLQVALLGVVGGLAVGVLVTAWLKGVFDTVLPLPVWRTPFEPGPFALAVVLGLTLPLVATAIPVWRAVRVEPVTAIRTGRFSSGRSGWARLVARLRWPRRSLQQYPIRNLLRSPRRTLLTALAVGAAITVLVGVFGMLDSMVRTVRLADDELVREAPDRLTVQLATFQPDTSATVEAVRTDPAVAEVAPGLVVPGRLASPGHEGFDVELDVLAADAPWTPSVAEGTTPSSTTGVLLSAKAARDLGVGPGDTVTLRHPRREGLGYRMVDSQVRVAGIHRLPLRSGVYLGADDAGLLGAEGITNVLQVVPAAGVGANEAQRALFSIDGVASAVPTGNAGKAFEDALRQYTSVLRVMELAVLALALLIAFNASSISVDERSREYATMFAFGVRRRTVLGTSIAESTGIGLLGTCFGLLGGYAVMVWMFGSLLPTTVPEIGIDAYLAPLTVLTVVVLGVLFVGLAPVLNIRKLRHMDIPATLRVVE